MIQPSSKTAIVFQDIQYSYNQLLQYISCYSKLFCIGNKPEKVLIFAENTPEWIFAFYGAMKLGAIVVPVDVQSTAKELAYIINDCSPDIIYTSAAKQTVVQQASKQVLDFHSTVLTKEDINTEGVGQLAVEALEEGGLDKTAFIIYTSGTTGSPKGVMLTYRNILYNVNAVSKSVPIFRQEDNVMILLPLHHAFPLMGSLVAPLYVGGTVHIAEGLNAETILKTLNDGKISIIIGVPRLYDTLAKGVMNKINGNFVMRSLFKTVKAIGSDKLSKAVFGSVHKKFGGHIEYLVSGGAALSKETAKIFKALGFYVLEGYGMTETAPMISFTRPGRRKIGCAGNPLPGIEVKIERNGEICVKGDNVMKGYYHREQETAQIIRGGWLHTGDTGMLTEDGLCLTGRIKDIIVTSNGKNINPEELEAEILHNSKLIKEVGVFMHESVLQALLVPNMLKVREANGSLNDVIKNEVALFNAEVAPYKRIKRFHVVAEELPKTRLGKIQRFLLPTMIEDQQKEKEKENLEDKSEIYKMLKAFIENESGYQAGENDHFEIDLSMDSLSRVSLLAYIETAFGVKMNEEQLEPVSTLTLLSEYIEKTSSGINDKEISWKEILAEKMHIDLPKAGCVNWLITHLFKAIFYLMYRYKGTGEKNIPNEPCIFVANHSSALDGVIITSRLKQKISKNTFFFAKEKYWRSRFAKFIAEKNNVILVDINRNVKDSIQQMAAVLKKGKNVIIFPEGTRSKNKHLNQFKETFAILSHEMNVPIVPVVIQGAERVSYGKIKFPRLFARIKVNFLKPVYPDINLSVKALRDKVVDIFKKVIEPKSNA
jgi:Long-chain acyl-CoA synthetases (AMP-forming)